MNKSIKKLWLKALRSGEYKQGKGDLKVNGKFCCLGVLCDLYKKETGKGKWSREHRSGVNSKAAGFVADAGDVGIGGLPNAVMNWAELDSAYPRCGKKSLDEYNDGEKLFATNKCKPGTSKSFKQIANLIQKYL